MTENLPPVRPPQPLSDPLMLVTILIGLMAMANIAFAMMMGHYANIFVSILIALGYLLIVAPRRRPNAIYLRAFKTDKSTARLRRYLSAALGPKFRLAGIRPPSERSTGARISARQTGRRALRSARSNPPQRSWRGGGAPSTLIRPTPP